MREIAALAGLRASRPEAIGEAADRRRRPRSPVGPSGRALIVAADHPARGALGAGRRAEAMADRRELLDRLCLALSRPGVTGVLGTPDIVEDLLLLGAIEGKAVFGSMNRGGLAGSVFELDDRFTAYDAVTLDDMGLEGGKMLLRIDPGDASSAATLQACGRAVGDLAARELIAMVEPFIAARVDGRLRNDLSADAVIRAAVIAAGLGPTSAYTWLKLPVVDDMERVAVATSLPTLLLGGEVADDQDATFASWERALAAPGVIGLVVGRSLLYPPDDDVAGAIDTAARLLEGAPACP